MYFEQCLTVLCCVLLIDLYTLVGLPKTCLGSVPTFCTLEDLIPRLKNYCVNFSTGSDEVKCSTLFRSQKQHLTRGTIFRFVLEHNVRLK